MSLGISEERAFACCSSKVFAELLSSRNPYKDVEQLITEARRIWWNDVNVTGWLEAFAAHPKIGDPKDVETKNAAFSVFSRTEQAVAGQTATEITSQELYDWNSKYLQKFGFIFIICAKGKSSAEILNALKERYNRTPYEELQQAAIEQMSITENRLRATFPSSNLDPATLQTTQRRTELVLSQLSPGHHTTTLRSPITSHVLDTALGCPAHGLPMVLYKMDDASHLFQKIGEGMTNEDGRVGNLMLPSSVIAPGLYKMHFNTGAYLTKCKQLHPQFFSEVPFYPRVDIEFIITADKSTDHYHIPLLLSPYGYSTYKGS